MRFIDSAGTIYEADQDSLTIQKKDSKVIKYRLKDISYPSQIKTDIWGYSSFYLTLINQKILIRTKKSKKAELEEFFKFLVESLRHLSSAKVKTVHEPITLMFDYHPESDIKYLINCPCCQKQISNQATSCPHCGQPINTPVQNTLQQEKFEGIYKNTFGVLREVYCPTCGSSDCSHYTETKIVPGKTKTTYTANLNPLKPFTIANKKEKVMRKEKSKEIHKFICNKCGGKFY